MPQTTRVVRFIRKGADAVAYSFVTNAECIYRDKGGVLNPASLTWSVLRTCGGSELALTTSDQMQYYGLAVQAVTKYSKGPEGCLPFSPDNFSLSGYGESELFGRLLSVTLTLRCNGTTVAKKTLPVVDAGADGENGDSPLTFRLNLSDDTIYRDKTGAYKPTQLSWSVLVTQGDLSEELTTAEGLEAYGLDIGAKHEYISANEVPIYGANFSTNVADLTAFGRTSTLTGILITLRRGAVVVDSIHVPVIAENCTIRGPRKWVDVADGSEFLSGAVGDPFLDVVIYGGNYYRCRSKHTKAADNYPGSPLDTNEGLWLAAADFDFVATKILLSEYALIKNLGAEAIQMYNGDNVVFEAKDGNVECNTGAFKNITVSGAIHTTKMTLQNIPAGGGMNDGSAIVRFGDECTGEAETFIFPQLAAGEVRSVDMILYNQSETDTTNFLQFQSDVANRVYFAFNGKYLTDFHVPSENQTLPEVGQIQLTAGDVSLLFAKGGLYKIFGVGRGAAGTFWNIVKISS